MSTDPDGTRDSAETPSLVTADLVRALRLVAALSQRELAAVSGLSRSLVERIESGAVQPRVSELRTLVDVAGWRVGVWDPTGRLGQALLEIRCPFRDGADRHYPAHLELIVDPQHGQWWGDGNGFQSPPETFRFDWTTRELRRAQSQWDVGRGPYKGRPNVPRP